MKYSAIYLSLATFLLIACGEEAPKEISETYRPVRYHTITSQTVIDQYRFSGTAQASEETSLSFKVSGTLNAVKVKTGDRVRKGQFIASIDPVDLQIQYDQTLSQKMSAEAQGQSAETQIMSAESQYLMAKSTYERIERLYENNSVPLSDYEQAKSSYEAAISQYKAAKAQYEASLSQTATAVKQMQAAQNQVNYARLTAPFTGIITTVLQEANELIPSGSPVALLAATENPEVRVGLPENYISTIRKGQEVNINFPTLGDNNYKGLVSEVAFVADQSSTYPVVISIKNPSPAIRPGMSADVRFHFGNGNRTNDLIAPSKAVGEDASGNFVFILLPSDNSDRYIVQKQPVKIGQLNAQGFAIREGLTAGDKVATAGLNSLLNGMEVKLLE